MSKHLSSLAAQCQGNQAPSADSPDKLTPVPFCLSNPNSTHNTAGQLFRDYTFSKSDTKGTAGTRTARRGSAERVLHECKCSHTFFFTICHTASFAVEKSFKHLLCIMGQPVVKVILNIMPLKCMEQWCVNHLHVQ